MTKQSGKPDYSSIISSLPPEMVLNKIDIYSHVLPTAYLDVVKQHCKDPGLVKRMTSIRMLWDIEARYNMLDQWEGLSQVLTLALPSPDMIGDATQSPGFARIANDAMADMVRAKPDKFPAFVAALPMNNIEASLAEMERAITQLGAKGIQINTMINGKGPDHPDFFPILEAATKQYKVPIWMHPFRPASMADYPTEDKSQYEIWQVLGWPYATSVAMARLVFSQVFDKLPDLRIITHHCGAMIPYFGGRAETLWAQLGSRSDGNDYQGLLERMAKKPIDYFKMFYADTVLGGSAAALRCGLEFFGPEKIVFASDCPFDPEGGPMFIREGIRSIEELDISEDEKKKIFLLNALKLLGKDSAASR
ncbi:MAG: amidohydrolase family protein [Pigmentiphaga sp.]